MNLTSYKNRIITDLSSRLGIERRYPVDSRSQLFLYRAGRDTICLGVLPDVSVNGDVYQINGSDLVYLLDSIWSANFTRMSNDKRRK